jgi:hypothetical protein
VGGPVAFFAHPYMAIIAPNLVVLLHGKAIYEGCTGVVFPEYSARLHDNLDDNHDNLKSDAHENGIWLAESIVFAWEK